MKKKKEKKKGKSLQREENDRKDVQGGDQIRVL